jgi:hypothetical protein
VFSLAVREIVLPLIFAKTQALFSLISARKKVALTSENFCKQDISRDVSNGPAFEK